MLIVGLAPGLHGAHRTGIPFFGDASGTLLLSALKESGFATPEHPDGEPIRITNVVKCLPPQNLPETGEVNRCQPFLEAELAKLRAPEGIIVCLGGVAHRAVLRALQQKLAGMPFGHGTRYVLKCGRQLVSSYHPSRLNINTRRLTADGFHRLIRSLK
ncbi:MAG: uracil-DNA glycosylase family protein [Pseudomonadota bacterium]